MQRMTPRREGRALAASARPPHVHDVGPTAWLLSHASTLLWAPRRHDTATPLAMHMPTPPGLLRALGTEPVGLLLPGPAARGAPAGSGGSGDRGVPGQTSGASPF